MVGRKEVEPFLANAESWVFGENPIENEVRITVVSSFALTLRKSK